MTHFSLQWKSKTFSRFVLSSSILSSTSSPVRWIRLKVSDWHKVIPKIYMAKKVYHTWVSQILIPCIKTVQLYPYFSLESVQAVCELFQFGHVKNSQHWPFLENHKREPAAKCSWFFLF